MRSVDAADRAFPHARGMGINNLLPMNPMLKSLFVLAFALGTAGAAEKRFVKLVPLPSPKVVASAEEYPGGSYSPTALVDGNARTEYSSNGKGTETFVEFEFAMPTRVAAFRHVDRNDPAIVAGSELVFLDSAGQEAAKVPVQHVAQRAGLTFIPLPEPVTASRVRWRITKLGSPHGTVGGAEIAFYAAGEPEAAPSGVGLEGALVQVIDRENRQPLRVTIDYPYANPVDAVLRLQDQPPRPVKLTLGKQSVEYTVPASESERTAKLAVEIDGNTVVERSLTLQPARHLTVYILPHSHTDIGYTEIQTEIEDKQVNNLLLGIKHARETANYPEGARFVWNVEVLWGADLYLRRLNETQRKEFIAALKRGDVALNGMYLNELTGLCRPEELIRLFRYATELREMTGATVDSAMISDVPGYTWGTVPAMAQAGIKYFSVAPNYFDRIGDILVQWENKPFWWVGPDGQSKVLVWIPYRGYAMSHMIHALKPEFVEQYQAQLDAAGYPYDIAYMRWAGHGDNAAPDPAICEFVKNWSGKYVWPRFVITSTSEAFRAFEARYGDQLPEVRGDWTPYWEDGAGSSALETAMNRASSERLAQAEALWAMQTPSTYPAADFRDAWNEVLLYSEHTWGAWCSISEPARRETREQWAVKQSYAVTADRLSRDLLSRALLPEQEAADHVAVDVFNTTSWDRTDIVTVPKYLAKDRTALKDDRGQAVPTQRLRNGELILQAAAVPALASSRFAFAGKEDVTPKVRNAAKAGGAVLENGRIRVRIDEKTGAIAELTLAGLDRNLVDSGSGHAVNDYLYMIGDNAADAQRNGPVSIRVGENGPLLASLIVESEAPGCFKLSREIRLTADADFVEIINLVDKRRLEAGSYYAREGKESVNFAFPFAVPGGQVRLDVPFGVVRPDLDQIPSACKNWFTVGRWADVANEEFGICWVTLDTPLVQVGGLTANLLNSQTNPEVWRKNVEPTQKLYAWAMNNHWGTNYRAYQEGPTVFRFVLRPHRGGTDPAEASRFATGCSQPLIATGARGRKKGSSSLFTASPACVLVTGLKPSDDGRAVIVRLFNASGERQVANLDWPVKPRSVRFTDTSETPGETVKGAIKLLPYGITALRVELSRAQM